MYYTYTALTNDNYTFTASPLTNDPDMYINADLFNNGTIVLPTLQRHMWFSNGLTNETIRISPQDPVYPCPVPCTYYIGLTGFIRPATFQLVVNRENSNTYPVLLNGVPQRGHLTPRFFQYFRYQVGANAASFQVMLTPLSGTIQVRLCLQVSSVCDDCILGRSMLCPCSREMMVWR